MSIPVGLLLSDTRLVRAGRSPTLIDLAFSRNAEWLLGPIAEAFCMLYEFESDKDRHDALVMRTASSMRTVDQSLPFAVRVARTGPAELLPRFASLVVKQCDSDSNLVRAHADLFESTASIRRNVPKLAEELGARALRHSQMPVAPLLHAVAEETNGHIERAREIRHRCGARTDAAQQRWWGEKVKKNLGTALTARELEVARLIAKGDAYKEFAQALDLSERTVHRHCESIFGKLRYPLSLAIG